MIELNSGGITDSMVDIRTCAAIIYFSRMFIGLLVLLVVLHNRLIHHATPYQAMLRGDNFNLYCQQSMEIVYNNRCIVPAEAAGTLIMGLPRNYGNTRKKQRNNHGISTELHPPTSPNSSIEPGKVKSMLNWIHSCR